MTMDLNSFTNILKWNQKDLIQTYEFNLQYKLYNWTKFYLTHKFFQMNKWGLWYV